MEEFRHDLLDKGFDGDVTILTKIRDLFHFMKQVPD